MAAYDPYRWTWGPLAVGTTTATIVARIAGTHEVITLQRKQGGVALPDIVLVEGNIGYARAELSGDGHYVATIHQLDKERIPGTIDYRFSLRACDTGKEVLNTLTSTPLSGFFVSGSMVYTISDAQLRALALPGLTVRWTVPLVPPPPLVAPPP